MAPPRKVTLDAAVAGLVERFAEISGIFEETQGDDLRNLPTDEVEVRLEELTSNWTTCADVYYDICTNFPAEQRQQHQFFEEKQFDVKKKEFRSAKVALRRLLPPEGNPLRSSTRLSSGLEAEDEARPGHSAAKLIRLDVPTFGGERAQWLNFRNSFASMVVSSNMSKVDKFNYLKNSLKGVAQNIVSGLPVSNESFDIAWSELTDRYDNVRLLKQAHVDALLVVTPVARAHDLVDYERVLNQIHGHLMSLKSLGADIEAWGDLLLGIVKSKFDSALVNEWERAVSVKLFDVTYTDFKKFVWGLTATQISLKTATKSIPGKSTEKRITRTHASNILACPECGNSHTLYNCPKIKAMESNRRFEAIKKHRVCFNCLSSGHVVSSCPSKRSCTLCHKRHHSLLHRPQLDSRKRPNEDQRSVCKQLSLSDAPPVEGRATALHVSRAGETTRVLLATAKVRIASSDGRQMTFRALIDQGSESSFVSERAARLLHVKREPANVVVMGIGGNVSERVHTSVSLCIYGLGARSPVFQIRALVLKTLTNHNPRVCVNIKWLPHLRNLELADDDPTGDAPIDLILGAEAFSSILRSGVRIGKETEPIAQETTLGWVLSGRVPEVNRRGDSRESASSLHVACVEKLDKDLRAFWEIEEVPSSSTLSPDECKAEDIFRETTSRRDDGRYVVQIPFKSECPELGDSRRRACECYEKLESRLRRDPDIAKLYHDFLTEYRDLGHMALDETFGDDPKLRYYLPHHPVIRESNLTTKLRVVFNASARSSNGNSLNDCMYVGPKLHGELFDILLRWRTFKYVCIADIEKMFRQINIAPTHTAFQCILWKPPGAEGTRTFRLNTVTYGTAAAPFLSMRVLKQLAEDERNTFPNASAVLHQNIYVDDVLFGTDSIEQCRQLRDELIKLLRAGGFPLHKWESNSEHLLFDLPDSLRARKSGKVFEERSYTKVLGIQWNNQIDSFTFNVKLGDDRRVTKRAVLSYIASIFDPLGWVAPTVVIAKILLQKLWKHQIDWDTELPDSLKLEWLAFREDLINLSEISIPRWLGTIVATREWELHGFADASIRAYAAVVYLKTADNSNVQIRLLVSKTRVAPVKEMTVPRLELSAAVLLSRLMSRVRDTLEMSNSRCYCWSDSSIVLAWLDAYPTKWKMFVANRVSQIHENMPGVEWRHVPTDHNPADLASRGVSAGVLPSLDLWWYGPSWLSAPCGSWPSLSGTKVDETSLEQRIRTTSLVAQFGKQADGPESLAVEFSTWKRLLSATARVKRRVALLRGTSPLPTACSAIQSASEFWVARIQQNLFSGELRILKGGGVIKKGPLVSLDPFLDKKGLIRVGGRLGNSELQFSVRCPIILGRHPVTRLIIESMHKTTLHGGMQLMRRMLREKYWIIRARDLIRACIRTCHDCIRHRAEMIPQKMGDLPPERVIPARAFSKVGIDYAGPFFIRALPGRGRPARKGYVAVFVCLSTRAIDLELVSDYTSEAFLAAFRRFASRRGLPALVMSDNGTTFQGAERELRKCFERIRKDKNLASWFANERVEWQFIPPHAPHFGGIWEAGVKSAKHHLRRVVNNQILTFEEMATLLAQIGACLNSRPIAMLSEDAHDFSYLTPGHFLCDGPLVAVPELDLSDVGENRLSRWQRVRQMRDQFWRIWRTDYLLQLQQRRKWTKSSPNLVIGDIVLLRNDTLPPCKWELGRVVECFPGKDGLVRVVRVKTAKSSFTRTVNKLCFLPLRSRSSAEEFE